MGERYMVAVVSGMDSEDTSMYQIQNSDQEKDIKYITDDEVK